MKKFTSVSDIEDLPSLLSEALRNKKRPYADKGKGQDKTLGLIFMNPSLRTRLSTQKAGMNLGMNVIVMNIDKEGWGLEFQDGAVMNGSTVEHIKEAAAVMGRYCDILGIRCFPGLVNREEDYHEEILNKFIRYCGVPVISMESATLHPLQSFADLITIEEHKTKKHPKVVLAWAPHVRALPQAVPNSFSEWMCRAQKDVGLDFVIAQPEGLELNPEFTRGAGITHNLDEALRGADFVYV
ncbi:MAG TPA: acetylornithine carbamoyltransferase, partial [Anseongella sp.]|nr:acetylornithine carbamoyltransferase [Anseongella sp.]